MVKKLCFVNAEVYLEWKIQLDHALRNRPSEFPKEKLDMVEALLGGDLLEYWKLWHQTASEKDMEGTYKKKDMGDL